MILDKKIPATLDQGRGCLVIFDEPPLDVLFASGIITLAIIRTVNHDRRELRQGGGCAV